MTIIATLCSIHKMRVIKNKLNSATERNSYSACSSSERSFETYGIDRVISVVTNKKIYQTVNLFIF